MAPVTRILSTRFVRLRLSSISDSNLVSRRGNYYYYFLICIFEFRLLVDSTEANDVKRREPRENRIETSVSLISHFVSVADELCAYGE